MARKSKQPDPPPPKQWTLVQISRDIQKLNRRIEEVEALETNQIHHDDPQVGALKSGIAATIEDIFGTGSREHIENSSVEIWKGPHRRTSFADSSQTIRLRNEAGFRAGIPDLIRKLQGLVLRLEEKKEDLEFSARELQIEGPPAGKHTSAIEIFISHNSRDAGIAEALINLLRTALNISADRIRCTSVDGYRLPGGASVEEQLRREVHEAKIFLGLITPSSIRSAYVLFELGARWGAKLHLIPLLAAGADYRYLKGPLENLNPLSCDSVAQVHQLLGDMAQGLDKPISNPSSYLRFLEALVESSQAAQDPSSNPESAKRVATVPLASYDDNDIIAVISHWMDSRTGQYETPLFKFSEIEADLGLEPGTAKKFIKEAAEDVGLRIQREGENTVKVFRMIAIA